MRCLLQLHVADDRVEKDLWFPLVLDIGRLDLWIFFGSKRRYLMRNFPRRHFETLDNIVLSYVLLLMVGLALRKLALVLGVIFLVPEIIFLFLVKAIHSTGFVNFYPRYVQKSFQRLGQRVVSLHDTARTIVGRVVVRLHLRTLVFSLEGVCDHVHHLFALFCCSILS